MDDTLLLLEAKELIANFQTLDLYHDYLISKENLDNNVRLNNLQKERIQLQKQITKLNDSEKDACIKKCKELQIEYDNDPLVINYNALKNDILELLRPLIDMNL